MTSRSARAAALAAALVCACSGCQAPALAPMQVVHVVAESGIRAGTPIDAGRILSALDFKDVGLGGVVADGNPMTWARLPSTPPSAALDDPAAFPRVAMFAGCEVFHRNEFWSGPTPAAGQPVLIAGYIADRHEDNLPAFFAMEPTFVSACILDAAAAPMKATSADLMWISAPPGDYCAFRGGPVGVARAEGPARILGIVLFQHVDPSAPPGADAILGVGRVPVSLREGES